MDGFTELALFTPKECEDIRARLIDVQSVWLRRAPVLPVFSLGAMVYTDAPDGRFPAYQVIARRQNTIIRQLFAAELETIRCVMEAWLDGPAEFPPWLAHPGFHIFLGGPRLTFNPASVHVDIPFHDVRWPEPGKLDVRNPVAFTVCISLPQCGGGLNVWDIRPHEPTATTRRAILKSVEGKEHTYLPYTVGHMLVHDGLNVHQIAYKDAEPGSMRITWQGHAVLYDGVWQLFV